MARKTHAIGYRLGESRWWETRTPPEMKRDAQQKITRKVIKGIMEKYGFITSEIMMQRKVEGLGTITMVGTKQGEAQRGEGSRVLGATGSTLEVYIINFVREMLHKYTGRKSEISYREEEKWYRNGEELFRKIVGSERSLVTTMRRIKRKVERK